MCHRVCIADHDRSRHCHHQLCHLSVKFTFPALIYIIFYSWTTLVTPRSTHVGCKWCCFFKFCMYLSLKVIFACHVLHFLSFCTNHHPQNTIWGTNNTLYHIFACNFPQVCYFLWTMTWRLKCWTKNSRRTIDSRSVKP